jgi:MoxR-like ATPase
MTTPAAELRARTLEAIRRRYLGPSEHVDLLLVAALARGHVLLEGVPGVAKTTLARAFADTLGCVFSRIQFTPDLLPADITGSHIFNMRDQTFELRQGPVFANVVLADEINRAPAKTQSALLEAMQEQQVTLEGRTLPLPPPFMVLATQNPVDQEGVYLLPEAQIDRFLFRIFLDYPDLEDELRMLSTYDRPLAAVTPLLDPAGLVALAAEADAVHIAPRLLDWIVRLVRATRVHPAVRLGASPRASLALMRCAKALALLSGRAMVLPDDIKRLIRPTLNHRVLLSPDAELDEVRVSDVIDRCLADTPFDTEA